MEIQYKKLTETAKVPTRGSSQAAGYDLSADIASPLSVPSGENRMVNTGIAMAIPDGYFGAVFPRSGLASKEGLRLANCVGVIDADYRGEIRVPIHNDSSEVRVISPGQKIAQMVILPFLAVDFIETDALSETERGEKGFGSTGV